MPDGALTYLLVEADQRHVTAIAAVFSSYAEIRLERAGSLQDARLRVEEAIPDLIIANWHMPDGESLSLAPGDFDHRILPIVLYGLDSPAGQGVRAIKAGALDFVRIVNGDFDALPPATERAMREWRHIRRMRQMEQELRRQQSLLHQVIHKAPGLVYVKDRQGRFVIANKPTADLCGETPDQLVGRRDNRNLGESLTAALKDTSPPRADTAATIYSGRESIQDPVTGETRWFHTVLAPADSGEGFDGCVIGYGHDVTENQRLATALLGQTQSNAAMTELARALATSATLDEISVLTLTLARRLTNSPDGYVRYVDGATGRLITATRTREGGSDLRDEALQEIPGLFRAALQNGQSLLCNDPANDDSTKGLPPGHGPIRRFMSAPACMGDTLVGQIAVSNADTDYSQQDLAQIERLACLYALAVQRRRDGEALGENETRLNKTQSGPGDP